MVVTSTSHALIIEFDGTATSSGTLDLQDTTAFSASAISGNYSMAVTGLDVTNLSLGNAGPAALGGVMTADGAGGFTNVTLDINDEGMITPGEPTVFGATSGPDSFGRVVMNDPNFQFVYYIVNAKALRLLEADTFFLTGGSAYTQGTSSLTVANLAGNSVLAEAGSTTQGSGSLGLAGQVTVDNNGNGIRRIHGCERRRIGREWFDRRQHFFRLQFRSRIAHTRRQRRIHRRRLPGLSRRSGNEHPRSQ